MAASDTRGPLAGLRVLDLTEHMAGPFCTMILADMGAEVLKVERPGKGDSSRSMGDGAERNPFFRYINRNKKSVTLDYKGPVGREVFLRLVRSVDVLVENYRATVMERAGLGYAVLAGENPRLVYAQLSGFGADGPYRDKGGLDLIAQGMGGLMHVTGEPDGPPTSVGQPICDLGTGMWGVQGILAALYERERTGHGQKVDCSLLETALGFSGWTGAAWLVDGREPTRQGARHRQNAPYQRFATQDGYMMIGAATQYLWERCARALGRGEWINDLRFRRNTDRLRHREALEKEIERVLGTQPTAHWVAALDAAGVPSGPVNTYTQLFADPQVRHLEMVVHADDPELGRVPHVRMPVRLSRSQVAVRSVAPKLAHGRGPERARIHPGRAGGAQARARDLTAGRGSAAEGIPRPEPGGDRTPRHPGGKDLVLDTLALEDEQAIEAGRHVDRAVAAVEAQHAAVARPPGGVGVVDRRHATVRATAGWRRERVAMARVDGASSRVPGNLDLHPVEPEIGLAVQRVPQGEEDGPERGELRGHLVGIDPRDRVAADGSVDTIRGTPAESRRA
jgi:crotonobetainyl-CoA:carnitine CoA-transferase CaiB-like acyl-CoA transferase